MKKADKENKLFEVLKKIPRILLVLILVSGVLLAGLVETNVITVRQIELFFRLIDDNEVTPVAPLTDLPEKARKFCVTAVDIGQGDCIVIEAGEKTVLIDSGEYEHFAEVEDFLHYRGIKALDMVIITH